MYLYMHTCLSIFLYFDNHTHWQCEIKDSAFGIVGVLGARVCCCRSLFTSLSEAGVVVVGNGSLSELECNILACSRLSLCLCWCVLVNTLCLA